MSIAAVILSSLLAVAAWCDLRWRVIPNWLCAALACAGLAFTAAGQGAEAVWTVAAAAAVFAGGAALFAAGMMGGGDVKLAAAVTLWLGAEQAPVFLFLTSVLGAGLAIAALCWTLAVATARGRTLRAGLRKGLAAGVPYGVAIAVAGAGTLSLGLGASA